jgi:kumamolisin
MAKFVALDGSRRSAPSRAKMIGPIDKSETATITVLLHSKGDRKKLEQWVMEQSAKPLDQQGSLSKADLEKDYGADPEDIERVEGYATSHNLSVVARHSGSRSLSLRGTLGNLLNAFPANVRMYQGPKGPYRGRTGDILVPDELSDVITGVIGFDTRPKHRAGFRVRVSGTEGPGGANGEVSTFFAQRYNFPDQYNGIKLDGTGQTIAIIELGGGYRNADLQTYFSEVGLPVPAVTSVAVDGVDNLPTKPGTADEEVMMDVEVAGTIAPKAKLVVYFAPSTDAGFVNAIRKAVHDPERRVDIISISWGGPEPVSGSAPQIDVQAYHDLFVDAAAQHITVCVASGDHGVAGMAADAWDGGIHVDHPAVDPLVLACGGTQIDANNNDVVWNDENPFDVSSNDGGGWASGGGISKWFNDKWFQDHQFPSYQVNAKLPASIDGGTHGRGVPDVAMSAINYFVRVDSVEGAGGGTSAVAPLMAALVARLNQAKQKNVGFLNTFLYAHSGTLHDVTLGDNGIAGTISGYKAGPGWDACTGLGTPDGTAILSAL